MPCHLWDQIGKLKHDLNETRIEVKELTVFVREQSCECVNEYGQNRTNGPCDRCKLLGEDGYRQITPGNLTLKEAQRTHCCRVCGETVYAPFILNFGKEFAHEKCLQPAKKPLSGLL